jgi:alkyl hydroperoxide reductase subunit AhpF
MLFKLSTDKTVSVAAAALQAAVQANHFGVMQVHNLKETNCSTSCPGIFAAGDVTDAFGKRIVIASGEGAKAALAARQYLLNLRKVVCV